MEETGMEETGAKPGTLKLFQRGIGKLFMVAAGMGAVVLVIFVVVPMLTAPVPEPPPMQAEEIVAEVLGEPEAGEVHTEALAPEDLPAVPIPLVAMRDNGEEVPVLFPAAEAPDADEGASPEAALPPVLSPEEIEAAVVVPVAADEGPSEGAPVPDAEPRPESAQASPPPPIAWQPELAVTQGSESSRIVEITLPPPEATREVQELLESLGYEPGPADGVWGDRTARAWRSFARDAADLEARVELAQASFDLRSGQTFTAEVPPHPEISALPSGGAGVLAAPGAGQVEPEGALRPSITLRQAQDQDRSGARVPGTLRGVMGYRLPLISRQEVPDQIVSGVLIPAHTTFVILRGGEWELVGLSPDEVRRLKGAAEAAAAPPESEPQPVRRSWNPLRLFRRQAPHQGDK